MYILTTSRKPGRKTRRFAKVLARFFNWRYLNRGKLSLEDINSLSETFWIISEVKGNPAILTLYERGEKRFEMNFTLSNVKKVNMDESAVVFQGKLPFDPVIFGAIPQTKAGLKLARKVDFRKRVVVKGNEWFFFYGEEELFKIRVLRIIQNSHQSL
uniref:Probable Brix domain-containing ribosomal biogenesis protein n=1 Tax=Archaeoglobus fulgidus TaxID=2234 RepID=A0A7C3MBD8_ARCFL